MDCSLKPYWKPATVVANSITTLEFSRNSGRDHGTWPYTFADVSPEPGPAAIDPHRRLRNLIEEIELADQVGLDVFGLGEHHRPDYAASAPVVALAAAAERTKRIKLTS